MLNLKNICINLIFNKIIMSNNNNFYDNEIKLQKKDQYEYWDKVLFSFTDDDWEFVSWIWILKAPNVNFKWDFWVDVTQSIVGAYKWNTLNVFYNDIKGVVIEN